MRPIAVVALAAALAAGGACGGDDDVADETLGPLNRAPDASGPVPSPPPTTGVVTTGDVAGDVAGTAGTAGTSAGRAMGTGAASIQVRLAATGVDETITLDRSAVAADELDPISLDATCTAAGVGSPGDEGFVVAVTDLRRLATGSRVVSARLHVDGEVAAAGEYEATLELGDADQVTTQYAGQVTVDELTDAATAGSFEASDGSGHAATGRFWCSRDGAAPTTAP